MAQLNITLNQEEILQLKCYTKVVTGVANKIY